MSVFVRERVCVRVCDGGGSVRPVNNFRTKCPLTQEVYNVLHSRQKRIERRPKVTCKEHFVKFGHAVLMHASGHTNTLIAILCTLPGGEVVIDDTLPVSSSNESFGNCMFSIDRAKHVLTSALLPRTLLTCFTSPWLKTSITNVY